MSNNSSKFSLTDKYTQFQKPVFLSGTQALVKLALIQKEIDYANGLDTGGFISGYRGSPLGGVDQAMWGAKALLEPKSIYFEPGVNEELAATACWGTQQLHIHPETALKDGVFAMWYAKGPGVDRSCDILKHANMAGTAPKGGVLAIAGDDHIAKSSSVAHQSEHIFKACGIPVLYPSNVQEIIELGLHGIAMSRFSGLWVGLKTVQEVVESTTSVEYYPQHFSSVIPSFTLPDKGLHIRWPDSPLEQEARLMDFKWYAALAYIKENNLNKHIFKGSSDKFGIVSAGKSFNDTLQAMKDLGLTAEVCAKKGIRLYKVGAVWPLEASGIREFATDLDEILVVEEKRQLIEYQLKEQLYGWREDVRPNVIGKFQEKEGDTSGGEWSYSNPSDHWLLTAKGDLSNESIAQAIYARLKIKGLEDGLVNPFESTVHVKETTEILQNPGSKRLPWFCGGCPHNTSTKVPEGSRALAGIGCHYMVQWMDRHTETFSQMGGEGVSWVGQSKFTSEQHVFSNLGDGTYYHSGLLAIRQSISAKVNITYKILYNSAVAMTGGQPVEGGLSVKNIVAELRAEGVEQIFIVTDDVLKYSNYSDCQVYHRDNLMDVQQQCVAIKGCTVIVYDQMCATEKRRKIKRGLLPSNDTKVIINKDVCEGCGDCSEQSNCISIEPLFTEFGVKRQINQSSCNKDLSCVKGFCPSFVQLEGVVKKDALKLKIDKFDPSKYVDSIAEPTLTSKFSLLIAGVGGTGTLTVGQLLGTACHLAGLKVIIQEAAGLAQKGGSTWCHVQASQEHSDCLTSKIPKHSSTCALLADSVVATSPETSAYLSCHVTVGVLNSAHIPTSEFITTKKDDPHKTGVNIEFTAKYLKQLKHVNFTQLAQVVFDDSLYTNIMMLGYLYQMGCLAVNQSHIFQAIELNEASVETNKAAFVMGRTICNDPSLISKFLSKEQIINIDGLKNSANKKDTLNMFKTRLIEYQSEAYACQFEKEFEEVSAKLEPALKGIVLRNLFKVYYQKDEFEVARLMLSAEFKSKLLENVQSYAAMYYNISPSFITSKKLKINAKLLNPLFSLLANLKTIRFSPFNLFAYQKERKFSVWLKNLYLELLNDPSVLASDFNTKKTIFEIPELLNGYGHIKTRNLSRVIDIATPYCHNSKIAILIKQGKEFL